MCGWTKGWGPWLQPRPPDDQTLAQRAQHLNHENEGLRYLRCALVPLVGEVESAEFGRTEGNAPEVI